MIVAARLFLLLIQMVVIPLVLSSVIRGIAASGDVRQLRTTGVGLGIYFVVTTVIATAIGIGLAYLVACVVLDRLVPGAAQPRR